MKILYDSLLEEGTLYDVLPAAKGVWEKDKKKFELYFEENEKMVQNYKVDFYEVEDEDDFI